MDRAVFRAIQGSRIGAYGELGRAATRTGITAQQRTAIRGKALTPPGVRRRTRGEGRNRVRPFWIIETNGHFPRLISDCSVRGLCPRI
jgi:hypothetical protein